MVQKQDLEKLGGLIDSVTFYLFLSTVGFTASLIAHSKLPFLSGLLWTVMHLFGSVSVILLLSFLGYGVVYAWSVNPDRKE